MDMLKHAMDCSDFILSLQQSRFLTTGFWVGIISSHVFFRGIGTYMELVLLGT